MSAEANSATPSAPAAPRYRYFTVAPATVRLTVDDLVALLPPEAWVGAAADKQRTLALPTAEILETNFPRIRASRLRDLLPGNLHLPADAPEWVALPTDRVALAYRPETRRELVPDATADATATTGEAPAESEPTVAVEAPTPSWKLVPKPVPAPVKLADLRPSAEAETRLQQMFLSEEELSVTRLVTVAGELPGLQGCALIRDSETVKSPNFPAGLDVPALASGATELLTGLGQSSGLHFQPAVTLYAESGPISLLHHGNFRLIVIHHERGFLPGVREKLAAALEVLATCSVPVDIASPS